MLTPPTNLMIYTSYYANRIPIKRIAISLYPPKWFEGECIKEWEKILNLPRNTLHTRLARGWSIDRALETPTPKSLKKPDEWCHRRLLAEYIEDRFDITMEELTKENSTDFIKCPAIPVEVTPEHVHKVCRLTYLGYPDTVQAKFLGITAEQVFDIKAGKIGEDISEDYDLSTPPNERLTFIPDFVNPDIDLYEPTHTYTLLSDPDQKFVSCTTLLHGYFEDFNAREVATNLCANNPRYKNREVDELLDEWNQVGIDGTAIHKELEDYILTQGEKDTHTVKAGHGKEWIKGILNNPEFIIYPEVILFIKELGIAGTIDLLIINKKTKVVYIADWKTNKKLSMRGFGGKKGIHPITYDLEDSKFNHYSLQLSLYRYILEKYYNLECSKLCIVHLTPKKCIPIPADYLGGHIAEIMEDRRQQLANSDK